MDGGEGSYDGFSIPEKLRSNENATYTCDARTNEVTFTAISTQDPANTVIAEIGTDGKFIQSQWTYTGEFL